MSKLKDKIIRALGGYTQQFITPPPPKIPIVTSQYKVEKIVSVLEMAPWLPESVEQDWLKSELIRQIDAVGGILYDRKVEDGFTKLYATALVCVKPNE